MNTREDQLAWEFIHSRPRLAISQARGYRALDYLQLGEKLAARVQFEIAWGDFLHAFYDFKDASFFAYPPPASLSPGWQAILAGAAEWLSQEFELPRPEWVDDPKFTLPTPWDPWGLTDDFDAGLSEIEEPFRKRNVLFQGRDLIAL
jgi:hypothetical protein